MDQSLIFPVPEDGSPELEHMIEGPEMPSNVVPAWPGFYLRLFRGNWGWNEYMEAGYWAAMGIFVHEDQHLPWRGAMLKAHKELLDRIEQLEKQLNEQPSNSSDRG